MGKKASNTRAGNDNRYQGFELESVCWGYRDLFKRMIDGLFEEGSIGPRKQRVTREVFDLLKKADRGCFDAVLKEFLEALNPATRWMMGLPSIFCDVVQTGRELAEKRLSHGIAFFRTLGEGGFGDTPESVRGLMSRMRRLGETDSDLAQGFMRGYRHLLSRLEPEEIDRYVQEGLSMHARNPALGVKFMEGSIKTSENIIDTLTSECRLQDVQSSLQSLLRALVGYEVDVADLGELDSDYLMERNTSVVCMYRWLYLPRRIRYFSERRMNRLWYTLCAVTAAGMLSEDSFCRIHGHPEYETCRDLVSGDVRRCNLFQALEYARVLRRIRKRWPGAARLLDFGTETEFRHSPPQSPADRLLVDVLNESERVEPLLSLADETTNCFQAAELMAGPAATCLKAEYPGLSSVPMRAARFLPDMLYPGTASTPPPEALVADLKNNARRKRPEEGEQDKADTRGDMYGETAGEQSEDAASSACCIYDEWSQEENDYYHDYCMVYERVPAICPNPILPESVTKNETKSVKRMFELLKPDLARREKRLAEGDDINTDLLVNYLVRKHLEPSPKVDFYERPVTRERDLAVLILLDVSGSTGAEVGSREKVLDVEKHATLLVAEGLAGLGDRFSVCGFSGNGRSNCEYLKFKDFEEMWGMEARNRILSAHPMGSTRMGAALRHSGRMMSHLRAKQRLVLVVTDGKPMDSGYDPNTRYAQYDVRVACIENERAGIHTFALCTGDNSPADLDIMFPLRRYAVISDIRNLPAVLPKVYLRLTA